MNIIPFQIKTGYFTCPNCGPRGGEAEAFPAGIYVRNLPITSLDFFATLAAMFVSDFI